MKTHLKNELIALGYLITINDSLKFTMEVGLGKIIGYNLALKIIEDFIEREFILPYLSGKENQVYNVSQIGKDYLSHLKEKSDRDDLINKQINSSIETNCSVRENNIIQKKLTWAIAISSIIYTLTAIATLRIQCNGQLPSKETTTEAEIKLKEQLNNPKVSDFLYRALVKEFLKDK